MIDLSAARHAMVVLAAGVVVAVGLNLLGLLSRIAGIERIGAVLWRHLQRPWRRLVPIKSAWGALLAGMIWGLLPCFLVYSALLWSMAANAVSAGCFAMLAFGAGTLPITLTVGLFSHRVLDGVAVGSLQKGLGVVMIVLGLVTIVNLGMPPEQHIH
ncbi:putative Cbb3-type cytochrome oxidase assembly protein [Magnetofaba australis IT-1]|uniref:Putative Cbb3-type cytochrome oxidase assembly protein n=2 Tax=Magnetofaba TaxID=1472292 RepID=A0A1Y2JZ95_9PROT|nr:putative Cbb3-type cytochrome oxidase assembly protein [Magnetofaba australis IT-1]